MQPNSDLTVDRRGLSGWNTPERRRASFHNLHNIHRRGLIFRAPASLDLVLEQNSAFARLPCLTQLLKEPSFCALVIVQDRRIVFEHQAADFATDKFHSIQSITKTFVHLALGALIESGKVDASRTIGYYVPEAGHAYANASVQQALDMNIATNFKEDYSTPYSPAAELGAPTSYSRQEIAMGWRLPPVGEEEFGVRSFAAGLVTAGQCDDRVSRYTSPNTDMLGWVIERASGHSLAAHVAAIVTKAGLESALQISADCEGVPVLSGGGIMTARDLARYGLFLARHHGSFLADTMSGAGTIYGGSPHLRYRNHLLSNGTWVGHPGYAGQFLMVDPAKNAVAAFFSVLETEYGDRDGYFAEIISVLETALLRLK